MAKLNGENVSFHIQIESLVQEREKIKLEYQKLFNSIKTTRVQHQQEVNELIENINQKTYAYGDVLAKNQDLLMTSFELKAKLKIAEKRKNVNTKFDKSATLTKLICVSPLNKNKDLKAKIVSKVEVKTDKSKPVTLCSTPKNEQGAESSTSVRRPEAKDTNSKKRVLLNISLRALLRMTRNLIKYSKLEATLVVTKSRFSVATPPKATNKVSRATSLTLESRQSKTLSTYMKNKIKTSRKRHKWFEQNRISSGHLRAQLHKHHQVFLRVVLALELTLEHRLLNRNRCSKYMTRNLKLLRIFAEKFTGTVRFRNDNFAAITGYEGYVQENLMICYVYYVKGHKRNLFLNLKGEDLLTGSCDSNLYTISIPKMAASSLVCIMSKATSTKSWLWHIRLSYLNFDETPEMIIKFITQIQQNIKVQVLKVGSDNGNKFKNEKLRKMKPKANIGIFVGYSESLRVFRIYNHKTRKIMETIHVKFDELTAMASRCNNSGHGLNCLNFQDSLEELNETPLNKDLDNLFGRLYEEYYVTRTPKVSDNFAANTLDMKTLLHLLQSSMKTMKWTKNHPIKEVIGDPSKPVTIRSKLHTDVEMCTHELAVSTTKPTNIKEDTLDHNWIKSMRDELNQFKRLDT
uniref:Retroviral polymerase SH3-like domain-containing protein n=1 Tax=Tanacetum cinerariifolium TaxID=118510 RepID=A0A6L2J4J9_TANCI|nr:hypothetical protein [Tanacetum cinerariifolium]